MITLRKSAGPMAVMLGVTLTLAGCSDTSTAADPDAGTHVDPNDGGADDGAAIDAGPPPLAPTWVDVTGVGDLTPMERGVMRLVPDTARNVVWMIGGQSLGPLPIGDMWSWTTAGWQPALGLDPSRRKNHGVAFDAARGRVVMYGGVVGGLAAPSEILSDMWEWDGEAWAEGPTGPGPLAGHGMVYDEARSEVILFGGAISGSSMSGATWAYDGKAWRELDVSPAPPPRLNTRLAYDSRRERVLLFGGQTHAGHALQDLWAWDGAMWAELQPEGELPPGRGFFAMAYDRDRDRLVVHGGTTTWPPFIATSNTFDDQWEYDGESWTRVEITGPGPRSGHDMAYDAQSAQLMLFGGSRDGTALLDDTWVLSGCADGESVCGEAGLAVCEAGEWSTPTACTSGTDCVAAVTPADELEAQCVETECAGTIESASHVVRFDATLGGDYRAVRVGRANGVDFDYIAVRHPPAFEGTLPIPDPREVPDAPVALYAFRGDLLFGATSGDVRIVSIGTGELPHYQVQLDGVELLEMTSDDTGREFVEGGESACLRRTDIGSVVLPYFCYEIEAGPEVGESACYDDDGSSWVVRCDEGRVSDATGNLGELVAVEDCAALGRRCDASAGTASCVAPL